MKITASELRLAGKVIESVTETAGKAAQEARAAAGNLLRSEALPAKAVAAEKAAPSAPAILNERIGTLITPPKLKNFAEDLYGRADRWGKNYELDDKINDVGRRLGKTISLADRALQRSGVEVENIYRLADTNSVYGRLADPSAKRAFTTFVNTRTEYKGILSEYNKTVVGPRVADTRQALTDFADSTGMFRPQLKFRTSMPGTGAAYADGKVMVPENTLTGFSGLLVNPMAHEATHLEQNFLQIAMKADQMNIGKVATKSQIEEISKWFEHMGNPTSPETIAKAIAVRNGRFLTDEAAERADSTIKSVQHVLELQAKEGPNRERMAALAAMDHRSTMGGDLKNVLLELKPNTGLALNNLLFGTARGPELFGKYGAQLDLVQKLPRLPRQTRDQLFFGLHDDLAAGVAETKTKMDPFYTAYRNSRHEVEAFNNGDLAETFKPKFKF